MYSKLSIPGDIDTTLQVTNQSGEVGKLFIKDGVIDFSGDATASARLFVQEITKQFPLVVLESFEAGRQAGLEVAKQAINRSKRVTVEDMQKDLLDWYATRYGKGICGDTTMPTGSAAN